MTNSIGNQPAFPCPVGHIECAHPVGMTLREHYIGQALNGILSCWHVQQEICNTDPRYRKQPDGHFNFAEVVALNCCEFSNAVIAALDKEKEE